jgi:hypothetical protein
MEFNKENIRWMIDERGLPACYHKIKVPSVTTVLNNMLPNPDYDKFVLEVGKEKAEEIMQGAGRRGTSLHTFIETFMSTYSKSGDVSEALRVTQEESPKLLLEEKIPESKIEEGRKLFYKFYYSEYPQRYKNIVAIEMGVFSPSLFYRGKLDILYKDPLFGLSITDLKSSNGRIKRGSSKEISYFFQLGGYANAFEEMYKEKNIVINQASILCVDKQTDLLQDISLTGAELAEYKEKFRNLVKEYHRKNGQEYLLTN